jgi:hypothetical protein
MKIPPCIIEGFKKLTADLEKDEGFQKMKAALEERKGRADERYEKDDIIRTHHMHMDQENKAWTRAGWGTEPTEAMPEEEDATDTDPYPDGEAGDESGKRCLACGAPEEECSCTRMCNQCFGVLSDQPTLRSLEVSLEMAQCSCFEEEGEGKDDVGWGMGHLLEGGDSEGGKGPVGIPGDHAAIAPEVSAGDHASIAHRWLDFPGDGLVGVDTKVTLPRPGKNVFQEYDVVDCARCGMAVPKARVKNVVFHKGVNLGSWNPTCIPCVNEITVRDEFGNIREFPLPMVKPYFMVVDPQQLGLEGGMAAVGKAALRLSDRLGVAEFGQPSGPFDADQREEDLKGPRECWNCGKWSEPWFTCFVLEEHILGPFPPICTTCGVVALKSADEELRVLVASKGGMGKGKEEVKGYQGKGKGKPVKGKGGKGKKQGKSAQDPAGVLSFCCFFSRRNRCRYGNYCRFNHQHLTPVQQVAVANGGLVYQCDRITIKGTCKHRDLNEHR